VREELARPCNAKPCPACEGTRLRREARSVRVGVARRRPADLDRSRKHGRSARRRRGFEALELPGRAKAAIGERIVREIRQPAAAF
jgi:excinuclease ABC subunit A